MQAGITKFGAYQLITNTVNLLMHNGVRTMWEEEKHKERVGQEREFFFYRQEVFLYCTPLSYILLHINYSVIYYDLWNP